MTKGKRIAAGPFVKLLGLTSGAGLIWMVLLPAVADWPAVAERRRCLQEFGIDPAARLYSDHPGATRMIAETAEAQRHWDLRLWLPPGWGKR